MESDVYGCLVLSFHFAGIKMGVGIRVRQPDSNSPGALIAALCYFLASFV